MPIVTWYGQHGVANVEMGAAVNIAAGALFVKKTERRKLSFLCGSPERFNKRTVILRFAEHDWCDVTFEKPELADQFQENVQEAIGKTACPDDASNAVAKVAGCADSEGNRELILTADVGESVYSAVKKASIGEVFVNPLPADTGDANKTDPLLLLRHVCSAWGAKDATKPDAAPALARLREELQTRDAELAQAHRNTETAQAQFLNQASPAQNAEVAQVRRDAEAMQARLRDELQARDAELTQAHRSAEAAQTQFREDTRIRNIEVAQVCRHAEAKQARFREELQSLEAELAQAQRNAEAAHAWFRNQETRARNEEGAQVRRDAEATQARLCEELRVRDIAIAQAHRESYDVQARLRVKLQVCTDELAEAHRNAEANLSHCRDEEARARYTEVAQVYRDSEVTLTQLREELRDRDADVARANQNGKAAQARLLEELQTRDAELAEVHRDAKDLRYALKRVESCSGWEHKRLLESEVDLRSDENKKRKTPPSPGFDRDTDAVQTQLPKTKSVRDTKVVEVQLPDKESRAQNVEAAQALLREDFSARGALAQASRNADAEPELRTLDGEVTMCNREAEATMARLRAELNHRGAEVARTHLLTKDAQAQLQSEQLKTRKAEEETARVLERMQTLEKEVRLCKSRVTESERVSAQKENESRELLGRSRFLEREVQLLQERLAEASSKWREPHAAGAAFASRGFGRPPPQEAQADPAQQIAELEIGPLRDCSNEEKGKLKRKLLMKWHPDKQPSVGHAEIAKRVMQELQNAEAWRI